MLCSVPPLIAPLGYFPISPFHLAPRVSAEVASYANKPSLTCESISTFWHLQIAKALKFGQLVHYICNTGIPSKGWEKLAFLKRIGFLQAFCY